MPPGKQHVQLRKANPGDSQAIAAIHIEARKRHLAFAPPAHTEEAIHVRVREQIVPADMTWVVDDGSAILAYMTLVVGPAGSWIDQLYAHPDATGRGHGTALLVLAKRELSAPIRLYTFQQNTRARRFYERAGFVVEKLSDGLTNEERCPDVLYRWPS